MKLLNLIVKWLKLPIVTATMTNEQMDKLDDMYTTPPISRKLKADNNGDIHDPENFESDDEFRERLLNDKSNQG